MILRRAAAVLPATGVSLVPKLICPLCWPAYAGLVSATGLGFLIAAGVGSRRKVLSGIDGNDACGPRPSYWRVDLE